MKSFEISTQGHLRLNLDVSYLTGKKKAVLDEYGNHSSFKPLNRGVPQGSGLGPLLFILFVNNIALGLDTSVFYIMYVRFPLEKLQSHVALMSSCEDLISQWVERNPSMLNVSKTPTIVIGSLLVY